MCENTLHLVLVIDSDYAIFKALIYHYTRGMMSSNNDGGMIDIVK